MGYSHFPGLPLGFSKPPISAILELNACQHTAIRALGPLLCAHHDTFFALRHTSPRRLSRVFVRVLEDIKWDFGCPESVEDVGLFRYWLS